MANAGIQSQISFKKESAWGTAVVPDKSIPVRPTGGIIIKENVQLIPAVQGMLQRNHNAIKGKVAYEGDLTMDAFADYIGYFILSALGTDTPATHSGESIVYDHVYTETAPKPSLTIEQAIDINTRRFSGAIVSSFKISAKVGEMIEFTATIIAKGQATATEISGAFTTVPAFKHNDAVIKIGGSTLTEVESFELEYKSGVEMIYAIGNSDPSQNGISNGSTVSIKMDLFLDSTALTRMTNYLAQTRESIELILTGAAIGTAANYVLDVLVPTAVYTTADSKVTDAHNMLSIAAEGVYDTVTSKLLGITLTNLISAY